MQRTARGRLPTGKSHKSLPRMAPERLKRLSHSSSSSFPQAYALRTLSARSGRPGPARPPPAPRAYLSLRQVLVWPQQVGSQEGLGRPEAGEEAISAEQRGGQDPALVGDPSGAQEHGGRRRRRPPGHRAGNIHPEREGRGPGPAPSFPFSSSASWSEVQALPPRGHLSQHVAPPLGSAGLCVGRPAGLLNTGSLTCLNAKLRRKGDTP